MLYEVIIYVVWNAVDLCLKYEWYLVKLNRSPTVYDVIVKNNSKDEEKSLTVLEW